MVGELVHRGGGVIVAKRWWVSWGPQVVGGWGQVWWVVGWWRPTNCCFAQKGMHLPWQ